MSVDGALNGLESIGLFIASSPRGVTRQSEYMHARCRRQVLPYPRSLSRLNFKETLTVHYTYIRASRIPSTKHQIETCEWNSISISISKDFVSLHLMIMISNFKAGLLVGCRKSAEKEFAALATSLNVGVQSKKDRFLASF